MFNLQLIYKYIRNLKSHLRYMGSLNDKNTNIIILLGI